MVIGWRIFYALRVLGVKKMRVLGNVNVNCALNWDYWDYFGSVLCAHVWCMILHCLAWIGMWFGYDFGWFVCVNRGKLCKSRPSEVISSKRELQNLVFSSASRFLSRRMVPGLSDGYSRLGESGSPKRGLVVVWCSLRRILVQARFVCFEWMYNSLRRAGLA